MEESVNDEEEEEESAKASGDGVASESVRNGGEANGKESECCCCYCFLSLVHLRDGFLWYWTAHTRCDRMRHQNRLDSETPAVPRVALPVPWQCPCLGVVGTGP